MLQSPITPLIVMLTIFIAACPLSLALHSLISYLRSAVGNATALAVYALEMMALLAWNAWYMNDLDANIASGRYDGPVGFERGMLGGFVLLFAAMLALQNGVGLLLLYRVVLRRALVATISGTWLGRANRYLHAIARYLHRSVMGWS